MCRKLGKGHPDYICRKDNQYVVGADGVRRMRRMYNGRRVVDHHGANVLNAMTDFRDKIWSWFPPQPGDGIVKSTRAKIKRLKRLERTSSHGMTRYGKVRRDHLRRNNVRVN